MYFCLLPQPVLVHFRVLADERMPGRLDRRCLAHLCDGCNSQHGRKPRSSVHFLSCFELRRCDYWRKMSAKRQRWRSGMYFRLTQSFDELADLHRHTGDPKLESDGKRLAKRILSSTIETQCKMFALAESLRDP